MNKPYRPNVGIVVFNNDGNVLVGERIHYPEVFQFPQGGMDDGETPEQAAKRELYEEVGLNLDNNSPVGEINEWLYYDFPEDIPDHLKKWAGQKQKWFFFHWDGSVAQLDLQVHEQEFRRVKWDNLDKIAESIVEFKRPVYSRIREEGSRIITDYLKNL